MKDKNHRKAVMKTVSWKIISSVVLFGLMWIGNVDLKDASWITAADFVIKIFLMYFHELLWQGRARKKV